MIDSQFSAVRNIIVCSEQRDLKDQIESILRTAPTPRHSIFWTRDTTDLIRHCSQHFGCLGLVDLTTFNEPLTDSMTAIHEFYLTGKEACLMALIDEGQFENSCLFKIGFRGVVSGARLATFGALAVRYWDSLVWPPQNITELVISNLPWRAIE